MHRFALSLPEVEEYEHGGLPSFRVRSRRFASMLDADGMNLAPRRGGDPRGGRRVARGVPGAVVRQATRRDAGRLHRAGPGGRRKASHQRLGGQDAEAAGPVALGGLRSRLTQAPSLIRTYLIFIGVRGCEDQVSSV